MSKDDSLKNALIWALGENTGVSSENIVRRWIGMELDWNGWPKDYWDFERCYRLLGFVPEIKISIMVDVNKIWKELVAQWDSLSEMYRKGDKEGIYEAIKAIESPYWKGSSMNGKDIEFDGKSSGESVKLKNGMTLTVKP